MMRRYLAIAVGLVGVGLITLPRCCRATHGVELLHMANRPDQYRLSNGEIELVVAPNIGRIVQLRPHRRR